MKLALLLLITLYVIRSVKCLDILALFHYPGKSHFYVFTPVIEELVRRGHNVTLVSHQKGNEHSPDNIRFIDIPVEELTEDIDVPDTKYSFIFRVLNMKKFAHKGLRYCEKLITEPRLKSLTSDNIKRFDLVLFEVFNSDCALYFVHKLKIPSVGICSTNLFPWHYARMGLTRNSYVHPDPNLGHGIHPSIVEKVLSIVSRTLFSLANKIWSQVPTKHLIESLTGEEIPPFLDIGRNVSLVLVNSHPILKGSPPAPSNVVDIGGIHMQSNNKPLPGELEDFIESSSQGVIFFSFGSMLKISSMKKEKVSAIRDAFSTLKNIRFIVKMDNTSDFGNIPNVIIRKWLPQEDILCHKNVKGFITHGGMMSTMEALHCEVPVVAVPFFADQYTNAKALQELGVGTILQYYNLDNHTLVEAVSTILQPEYQKAAKSMSKLWKDRIVSPIDTAMYWIEHVGRNGGHHLRPSSADVPFYQFYYIDVLLYLIFHIVVIPILLFKAVKIFKTLKKSKKE